MSSSKESDDDPPHSKRARSSMSFVIADQIGQENQIEVKNQEENEQQPEKKRTRYSTRLTLSKLQERKISKKSTIWLPTECWVDICKLFSRCHLVRRVQPVSRRLHHICELHLDSRHEFRFFGRFLNFLTHNLPRTKQLQDKISTGLERHFVIGFLLSPRFKFRQIGMGQQQQDIYQRRIRMLDVLRNCPNLFRDCHLKLQFADKSQVAHPTAEYLDQLNRCIRHPFCIHLGYTMAPSAELLQHPLLLNTPRLKIDAWQWNDENVEASADTFCQWLHHKSSDETGSGITTRVFYFAYSCTSGHVQRIVDSSKQLLEQAKTLADRRAFMFLFARREPPYPVKFEMKNAHTGEMLKMERHPKPSPWDQHYRNYVLRRCLAKDNSANIEDDDKFYRETLEQMGAFNGLPTKNGKDMPVLEIH